MRKASIDFIKLVVQDDLAVLSIFPEPKCYSKA